MSSGERWDAAPRSVGEFTERVAEVGLGGHAAALSALARPSVRLIPAQGDPSGASRLAGCPTCPTGNRGRRVRTDR